GSVPALPDTTIATDTAAPPIDTTPRVREVVAIELAALADSAAAVRMADSLRTAGWGAVMLRRGTGDSVPPWQVRVASPGDLLVGQLAGARMPAEGRRAVLVRDFAIRRGPAVL